MFSFIGFTIFARIEQSQRGFPRLIHEGKPYYAKSKSKIKDYTHWQCTRKLRGQGKNMKTKRCKATARTKIINGYTMLQPVNAVHDCDETALC